MLAFIKHLFTDSLRHAATQFCIQKHIHKVLAESTIIGQLLYPMPYQKTDMHTHTHKVPENTAYTLLFHHLQRLQETII